MKKMHPTERWGRLVETIKSRARGLKNETYALYLAMRHPATPWYARLLAAVVVAYAFSPIDLIPDFIPVLGYLDDLLLIPLGVALTIRLIPGPVMAECRAQAARNLQNSQPVSRWGIVVVVLIWVLAAAVFIYTLWRILAN